VTPSGLRRLSGKASVDQVRDAGHAQFERDEGLAQLRGVPRPDRFVSQYFERRAVAIAPGLVEGRALRMDDDRESDLVRAVVSSGQIK